MSALDRAFIKAYAKDIPSAEAASSASSPTAAGAAVADQSAARANRRAALPAAPQSQIIEQIYHEGTLYRVETPAAAPRRVTVPAPHFQLPPRTSPRRNVRRSLLKLLGAEGQTTTPMLVDPPAARVVPAPKLDLLPRAKANPPVKGPRRTLVRPAPTANPNPLHASRSKIELAPESVGDVPSPVAPLPVTPLPSAPAPAASPNSEPPSPSGAPAPLNSAPPAAVTISLAEQLGPQIAIHGHWESDDFAATSSFVVLKEPADLELTATAQLLELKLDALPIPSLPPVAAATPTFRVDPPHATARPHARFHSQFESAAVIGEEAEEVAVEAIDEPTTGYFGDVAIDQDEPAARDEAIADVSSAEEELNFADLDPAQAAATIAAVAGEHDETNASDDESAVEHAPPTEVATDCIPVWEVDRFQWPITVERLTADKSGYFAQAGERLVAAVRDGLRTLAITGSRRGEGRSTLALCLARAAAKAGIQVAVIDADFARPQLAGKIGLEITHGWQDAATGLIPLSEAAVRSLTDNITVLPLEASAARGQLALSDPRVTATLRAAAATFELVIVDLGPLPTDEELFPEGEGCPFDAAIVVRDLRYASAAESADVGERLYAAGIEAVGVAENFVVEEEIPVTSV
jgi:Mrp family chromosome partitioning ATPase